MSSGVFASKAATREPAARTFQNLGTHGSELHAVQAIAVNVGLYKILYELLNRRPLFPTHEGLSLRRWDVPTISEERVERAARLYASNRAAAAALGIAPGSFGRLCRF